MTTRIAASNVDTYTPHHLADPTYPKTVIVPIGVNSYNIKYAHDKPLSDFTVDDCPDSVFNYDCQYFKSIMTLKSTYERNIETVKHQLEAFDDKLKEDFINSRIDNLYITAVNKIHANINTLISTTAEDIVRDVSNNSIDAEDMNVRDLNSLNDAIETELSEQQSALDSVGEEVLEDLETEWYEMHHTTSESKDHLTKMLADWLNGIDQLSNSITEWKQFALNSAIEYERIQIQEFNAIPRTANEFMTQLRTLYNSVISSSTQDVKNSALDVICSKLPRAVVDKYCDHIHGYTLLNRRCKCYKCIDTFMTLVRTRIIAIVSELKYQLFGSNTDWYDCKKSLFPLIETYVSNMSRMLFTQINERLSLLPKYDSSMQNIPQVKRVSNEVVEQINANLIDFQFTEQDINNDISTSNLIDMINNINEAYVQTGNRRTLNKRGSQ